MNKTAINFNKKTILITGGAGFIGSNIAFYIQEKYPESQIIVFDCFRSGKTFENGNLQSFGHYENLIGFKGKIICGNIKNPDDLLILNNYKFDFIFHQAAISDTRIYDQEEVMRTNVNSFYWFLDKTKKDNAVLVYASSAATYGSLDSPQKIGMELPENPYGYSKYMMDQIAMDYLKSNPTMKIFGLRFFNVYGPKEAHKLKTSSMINQLCGQILNESNPRLFFESEKIFRDFIYIDDVVDANIKACHASQSGIYNVGTGKARSFKDIVDILQDLLQTNYEVEYFPNPYRGYQFHTEADISLTKKYLGYSPAYSLETGIEKYLPDLIRNFKNTDV